MGNRNEAQGFVLTRLAQADLDAIQDYLLAHGESASIIVGDALDAAFRLIGEFPNSGHERPELTGRPVRFWPVYSYLIVYDPKTRPIRIVRVIHASRDVARVLATRARSG